MQEGMREAFRLWLRTARISGVVALLECPEVVKAELVTRNIILEFSVTHRSPEGGSAE